MKMPIKYLSNTAFLLRMRGFPYILMIEIGSAKREVIKSDIIGNYVTSKK